jgi:hypothetical protein
MVELIRRIESLKNRGSVGEDEEISRHPS